MYKIELNKELIDDLHIVVERYKDYIFNYNCIVNKKSRNVWNTLCTIMDRIEDIVYYLNDFELDEKQFSRSAFNFYDFINEASVLIECIDILAEMYNLKISTNKTNIFKNKYINEEKKKELLKLGKLEEKENDDEYFKYIRSLSSVHPADTDRHRIYMSGDLEVSPYVIWNDGKIFRHNDGDLIIVAYSDEKEFKNIPIYISEVFEYIKTKYNCIKNIIEKIEDVNEEQIVDFKNAKIKNISDFDDYNDYLNNLIQEANIRCPNISSDLEEARDIMKISFENEVNNKLHTEYCELLKVGIKNIHNCLQNMNFEFNDDESNFLEKILYPSVRFENHDYHYYREKINYLKGEYGDAYVGRECFKLMLPIFRKYIVITDDDFNYSLYDYELYVLAKIAIFSSLK